MINVRRSIPSAETKEFKEGIWSHGFVGADVGGGIRMSSDWSFWASGVRWRLDQNGRWASASKIR